MRQYYYTVAALPMLRYEEAPVTSLEDFLSACGQRLHPRDMHLVDSARLDDPAPGMPSYSVLSEWQQWESNLRNELVNLRAQKTGIDPHLYLQPVPFMTGLSELAQEAFGMSSPLEAESFLNRMRWNYLEDLEAGHHFDTDKLIVYSLKLQLLIRKFAMDHDRGEEAFNRIYSQIKETIKPGEI